jgi:hypothetical protein
LKHELKLKPFQQILEKVIQTYLLEVEMRKKCANGIEISKTLEEV